MYLDDVFAAFQIFFEASDIDEFRSWVKRYHNNEDIDSLFLGYRYFLEVSSLLLLDEISEDDDSLELDSDEIYWAAQQEGLKLDEIPNSCDKIVFIKNIWNYLEPIRDAPNWEELKKIIKKTYDVIEILNKVFKNVEPRDNISKETASRIGILNYVHHRLNDTGGGRPKGANIGLIELSVDRPGIEFFLGYAYTLEYIWYIFLGKNDFEKSLARFIHNPLLAMKDEEIEELREYASLTDNDEPEYRQSKIAWGSLDKLFHPLYDQNLSHLWKENKISHETIFVFQKNYDKNLIFPLLDQSTITQPAYLSEDTSEAGLFKKIDYQFRWIEISVISANHANDCFGTYAFIPFLLGITTSKEVSSRNKIVIIRIRHFEKAIKGFIFSYAILNKGYFFNGHGVGWLIFLTVGNEVSGHGGSLYREVENYIKKYEDAGILKIRQFDIDEDVFKKYLRIKTDFYFDDEDIPINVLLALGENQNVEFKSSLIWDHWKNQKSGHSEYYILKAIVSFLNSDGGTLLIGVDDKGNILGLENDYSQLGETRHRNRDGFERHLRDKIETFLGKTNNYYIRMKFEPIEEKEICRISILRSDNPVFLKNNNDSEFFIRSGNRSEKLTIQGFYEYLQKHWSLKKMRT